MAELLDPTEIFFTPYEPKLANRFIMYIEGVPAYLIKGASRPNINFNPIVPSAAQAVMEWVRLSHESVTGRDGYSDFYKKDITFNVLGPVGDKVEEWTLKGAFITATTFGDMDWSTDNFVEISLTLSYDYAILQF
jgi:hypothetical protein